jgi:hypothetical protein
MGEKLFLTFDNEYAVPPEYAMAWLLDFREDDMQHAGGAKMPAIRVTKLPDGRIQREFALPMGLGNFVTKTRVESKDTWIADCENRDPKSGKVTSTNRIVESVRPAGPGTRHHVDLYQTDLTLKSRIFAALGKPMQRAQIKKLFAVQKRDMEAAHKAGKPPTA